MIPLHDSVRSWGDTNQIYSIRSHKNIFFEFDDAKAMGRTGALSSELVKQSFVSLSIL